MLRWPPHPIPPPSLSPSALLSAPLPVVNVSLKITVYVSLSRAQTQHVRYVKLVAEFYCVCEH